MKIRAEVKVDVRVGPGREIWRTPITTTADDARETIREQVRALKPALLELEGFTLRILDGPALQRWLEIEWSVE